MLAMAQIGGVDVLKFSCPDEYGSSNKDYPTIMQNFVERKLAPRTAMPQPAAKTLGLASLPFKVEASALTGPRPSDTSRGRSSRGAFTVKFNFTFSHFAMPILKARVSGKVEAETAGTFKLSIQDAGGR